MKKRLKILLILGLFVLLISACQFATSETLPSIPGIDISADHKNQEIDLMLLPSQNTFKINDSVVVNVRLQTDIQVSSDFDVKMYALDAKNNSWIEVVDGTDNSNSLPLNHELFILDKNDPVSIIVVHPVLKETNNKIKFLITVKASIVENNEKTNRNVEAYIILTLHP